MGRRKPTTDEVLADILEGVDIIGTLLDRDLPRLREEIAELRATRTRGDPPRPVRPASRRSGDVPDGVAESLAEIRDLLEEQQRHLAALDRRLTRLADAVSARREDRSR